MKTVIADKIASVAQHRPIQRKLQVSPDIPCEEGVLVAARILNSKSSYNTLELTSGRMAKVRRGDIIVEIDRKAIKNARDLSKKLEASKKSVLVLVRRGEATLFVPLKRAG